YGRALRRASECRRLSRPPQAAALGRPRDLRGRALFQILPAVRSGMPERKVTHATFSIERTYDVPPTKVFAAFASLEAKQKWFAGPDEWQLGKRSMDFRVGGTEHLSGGPKGKLPHHFDAIYQDIVPNERIIYSYDMHIGENRISVSLATIEFKPAG